MRIFVLGGESGDLAAIENAFRQGEVELLNASSPPASVAINERRYVFASWMLDATTRELVSAGGRRVDLTSSEFDLLLAFLRQPGQALSRGALLGALRGRAWNYFDRSIDTLVARLRKKIDAEAGRPTLIRSVRGVGYVFCANVSHPRPANRSAAA
jgi:DNA-binding response OmpR family regulator